MQVSSHLPVSGAVSAPPIVPAEQGDRIDLPDTEALTLNRHVIAKASKKFPLPFYPAARPDSRPTVAPLMLFGRDRKRVLQTLLGAPAAFTGLSPACSEPSSEVTTNREDAMRTEAHDATVLARLMSILRESHGSGRIALPAGASSGARRACARDAALRGLLEAMRCRVRERQDQAPPAPRCRVQRGSQRPGRPKWTFA